MTFFNPLLLWGIPLSAFPLILHLISIRRARNVVFSDLSLLREVYLKMLPRSRLQQWLLILARCLIVLFLILGFSRPVFSPEAYSGIPGEDTGQGVGLVILIDVSYSMGYKTGGRTRLEAAKDVGLSVLISLGPRDRVALGTFSDRWEGAPLEWALDHDAAAQALRDVSVTNRPTRFAPALEKAYAFLSRQEISRKGILFLSDNAAHGFGDVSSRNLFKTIPSYDKAVKIIGVDWGDSPGNAFISEIAPLTELGTAEVKLDAVIGLSGSGRPDWGISLWKKGQLVARRRLNLKPAGILGQEVSLGFESRPGRVVWGKAVLQRDNLAADDTYFFSAAVRPRPAVLCVYGGPRFLEMKHGGYFLRELFKVPAGARDSGVPFQCDFIDFVRFKPGMLKDYQVLILAGFKSYPEKVSLAAREFVRGGGGAWIILEPESGSSLSDSLKFILPARVGVAIEETRAERIDLVRENLPDSSMWNFKWEDFEIEKIRVKKFVALFPREGANIRVRTGSGRPLAVEKEFGKGRVLLWGTSLDLEATNWALKPVFAAWMNASLGSLANIRRINVRRMISVGRTYRRDWPRGEDIPGKVLVVSPNGDRTRIHLKGRRMEFAGTGEPGNYKLEFDFGASYGARHQVPGAVQKRQDVFSVNLDRRSGEGVLEAAKPLPWDLMAPGDISRNIQVLFYGREARSFFLAAVLVLLGFETVLSRRRLPE